VISLFPVKRQTVNAESACENAKSNRSYFTLPYEIACAQMAPQKANIEYSRVDNSCARPCHIWLAERQSFVDEAFLSLTIIRGKVFGNSRSQSCCKGLRDIGQGLGASIACQLSRTGGP